MPDVLLVGRSDVDVKAASSLSRARNMTSNSRQGSKPWTGLSALDHTADVAGSEKENPGLPPGVKVKPTTQMRSRTVNTKVQPEADNGNTTLPDNMIFNEDPDTGDTTIEFGELTDSLGSAVRVRTYMYPECNEGAFVSMDAGGCEAATFRADEAEQAGKWLMLAAEYARSLSTKAASQ